MPRRATAAARRRPPQYRPGPSHIGERQIGADELQPGLDRKNGEGVGQLRPYTLSPGEVLVGPPRISLWTSHPGHRVTTGGYWTNGSLVG
jgi:hypothetical protein